MIFDFSPDAGLVGLAASAFVSATVLPGNSEVVLLALLAKFPALLWQAVGIATVFNALGGMTSVGLGRLVPHGARVDARLARALPLLQRHGTYALLLSWVPVIGDALCVAAGWLRLPWWRSALFIAAGKFARYLVVAWGASWIAAPI